MQVKTGQQEEKPYYVTTPIFYVNAQPHVGHMYSMLLADVLKRWQKFKRREAILCTGTDEHGMKMQQAAEKAKVHPQVMCDENAETFKDLASRVGIDYDIFMRTTSSKHKEAVEYAWQILMERGYIYESKHEGWYSVSDETFYPPSQVQLTIDPPTGRKIMTSIETGKEVEWTSESNYHFRLSAFRDKLLAFYKENPQWIVPQTRMDDVVKQVSEKLEDLSISRPSSRLTWGVKVPTDSTQTIYVWLDALLNYATAVGYPFTPGQESSGGWPADVHVIGKDIVRFHCIYWPAFLMALDLPLPRRILSHAHWTLNKQKMAKSTGNVVNPFWALDRFNVDAMRYFLIHDGGIRDDSDYDNKHIVERYRKGLSGGLGNLASRIMKSRSWDVPHAVTQHAPSAWQNNFIQKNDDPKMKHFFNGLETARKQVKAEMKASAPGKALQLTMGMVYGANAYLQHAAPWAIAERLRHIAADTTGQSMYDLEQQGKSPEDLEREIGRIIYCVTESTRLAGLILQAFIPESSEKLLDLIGVAKERRTHDWLRIGRDQDYGKPIGSASRGDVVFPPILIDE